LKAWGFEKNADQAAKVLCRLTEQDYLTANVAYAQCLIRGEGVQVDMKRARPYLDEVPGNRDSRITLQLHDDFSMVLTFSRPERFDELIGSTSSYLEVAFNAENYVVIGEVNGTGHIAIMKHMKRMSDDVELVVKFFTPDMQRTST
jgi:hypothetical protein